MLAKRLTIADLRALKGRRQLTMLRVETLEEAEAAQHAGIDMISVPPSLAQDVRFRDVAPSIFVVCSLSYGVYVTVEDYLRGAFAVLRAGADAVYCSASTKVISALRQEAIPVCGHAGLIPSQATWTGGLKAVGKTAESAAQVWKQVKVLEEAGAVMTELEVVPEELATEIARRTSLFVISMGSGGGCDAQYLFAKDVLGSHDGHYPRHARVYRDFRAEAERLQRERIAAFSEYAADVRSGAFPGPSETVRMDPGELEQFLKTLEE